jgi:hypothetical protein
MKKYIIALMLFISVPTLAANTTGYAWSESVGWFDFANVTVTNTTVTGHAYNDNTGWLVLDGITNTNGTLEGFAWSESVGYFNFASTTIQNGAFKGYAYNDNTGWLSFETGTSVTTSWTPAVVAPTPTPTPSGGGGGSSGGPSAVPLSLRTPTTFPQVNTPATVPNITTPTNTQIITQLTSTSRNLKQNTRGGDVKTLQQFLNQQGFTISNKGLGSPGLESTFFGNQTKQALIKFQIKNNIKPASGFFGPITKAFIKSMPKTN